MNIIYCLNEFPKLSESFILNEIYSLEQEGHSITIISINSPEDDIYHEEFEELKADIHYIDISPFDVYKSLSPEIISNNITNYLEKGVGVKYIIASIVIGREGINFLEDKETDVDLVHSHFATTAAMGARHIADYFNVPASITTHAGGLYAHDNNQRRDWILESMDRIITISNYNREFIDSELSVNSPIHIVHAGIQYSKFSREQDIVPQRILTTSRFIEKKGLASAIRGIAQVQEKFPNLEYHIIGSGEREGYIKEEIDRLGLYPNVRILGTVSDQRLIQELGEASIFLLPCVVDANGDRDGIPVALMEAMAMDTVPISTHVSGIPELIENGENGFLVNPRSPGEISEKITHVFTCNNIRHIRNKAKDKVFFEFSSEKVVSDLIEVFEKILDRDSN